MSIHESFAFRPQPEEATNVQSQWHLELDLHAAQRKSPGSVVERGVDQVKDQVEQGVRTTIRETQAAARAARERTEIANFLVQNFDLIDGSNRTHSRDGKITPPEIRDFRRAENASLTTNEQRNLTVVQREFLTQIGRGKDWANKADIETYRTSPPVVIRRPDPRREEEGIDDKVKDKVKGIWQGIRRKVSD